jgi:predicted ABC-type exoprotein transport system permease subunit
MKKSIGVSLFCVYALPLFAHGGSMEVRFVVLAIFLLVAGFGIFVFILLLKQIQKAPEGDHVPKIALIVFLLLVLLGIMTCGR